MSFRYAKVADEAKETLLRGETFVHELEWRIFTNMTISIVPVAYDSSNHKTKYMVIAWCDYELKANCQTIERAIEIAMLFEDTIPLMWRQIGWPSWLARDKME